VRLSDDVVVPQIWNQEGRSLDKPFIRFLAHGSMTSNPEYWKTIHVLFDRLRGTIGAQTSELFLWVNQGLLIGVTKEMRPSAAVAQQVTYTILMEIIQDIKEEGARAEAWKTEFSPRLREYLTSTGAAVSQPAAAFGYVLPLLNSAKEFEDIWGVECQYLIDLMSQSPVTSDSEIRFAPVSIKWTEIVLSMLRNFGNYEAKSSAAIFSKEIERVIEATIAVILTTDGHWVDGMSFLATFVQDHSFTSSDLTSGCLYDLKVLTSSENVLKLLHSPSSEKFIGVLVVLWQQYRKEIPELWNIVVNEAIPTSQVIDVGDPNSLFSHLLITLGNPKPGPRSKDFILGDDLNMNLVREIAYVIKISDDDKLEQMLISLINLRGRLGLLLHCANVGRNSCL
jgi:hypothetical protein